MLGTKEDTSMQIKKILHPTDFSESAEKAFEYALFMAESHEAELTLLHVVDQLHGLSHYEVLAITPMELAEKLAKKANENLGVLIDRAKGSVTATAAVRQGKGWDEICKAAAEEEADIIVMGSHGRTGLSHVLIGSVAETVVRHANCPVLVVRDTSE
jgi:universal stress protein A